MSRAQEPQLLSPCATAAEARMPESPCSTTRKVTTMRSPCTTTGEQTPLATTRESPRTATKTQTSREKRTSKVQRVMLPSLHLNIRKISTNIIFDLRNHLRLCSLFSPLRLLSFLLIILYYILYKSYMLLVYVLNK